MPVAKRLSTARSVTAKQPAHARVLPPFIQPMLAKPGKPFDSDRYLFEVKWDGTRAITYVDAPGRLRIMNRRKHDIAWRYPEFQFLAQELRPGTVLDGEIVVLDKFGKPDFSALQSREQVRPTARWKRQVRQRPATYMVFDQLYDEYRTLMSWRCEERRDMAARTVRDLGSRYAVMSEGVIGAGIEYFKRADWRGLEGVVAKRIDSPYLPGKRTDAWVKIKRSVEIPCVVIGFDPEGTKDFGALLVAAQPTPGEGELAFCGKVGSGFDAALRSEINALLWWHLRNDPVVPCGQKRARWVDPVIYCTVRCMERTASGQMRAPAFGRLLNAR
jgi:ATP-dependent DNA ligase